MSRRLQLLVLVLSGLLPLAVACTASMMSGPASMGAQIDRTRSEVQEHLDRVLAAETLPAVGSEMTRHDLAMSSISNDMNGAMHDMRHCTGPGMPRMGEMRAHMSDEMTAHDAAMREGHDLAAARAEAARHASAMHGMMDEMDGALGDMDCGMH